MQSLDSTTNARAGDLKCAALVIETILLGMRAFRAGMRDARPCDLSVPQFRVLAFLTHHEGASLSDAAEHIGLTLPSMSKAVNVLVRRGLIARHTSGEDRRRVKLALTEAGIDILAGATEATRARFAGLLAALPADQLSLVISAMGILRSLLAKNGTRRE